LTKNGSLLFLKAVWSAVAKKKQLLILAAIAL
jgi:hypothetical protein